MRIRVFAIGVMAAAAAWSAAAQPMVDQARSDFQTELGRQCPDKQLQMLSARNLSDGLDSYKEGLSSDLQTQFTQAETAACSSLDAGAECVNNADLATADQTGHIGDLAASICASFLRCRDEGDCDYAR